MVRKLAPAPKIADYRDLLNTIAHNPKERIDFILLETNKARARCEKKFPQGLTAAVRKNLEAVFRAEGTDIAAIQRVRDQFGINGPKGSSEKRFDQLLEARCDRSFEAEYNFLCAVGSLIGLSRHALKEVIDASPEQHFGRCKEILNHTVMALHAVRKASPHYVPTNHKSMLPGDTFTHNASMEFVSASCDMALRHALHCVEAMESIAKQNKTISTTEAIKTANELGWLRKLILAVIRLLEQFTTPQPKPLQLQGQNTEIPEPMHTAIKMMEVTQHAIAVLMIELEENPAVYLSQHLALLHDLANAARMVQAQATPEHKV